MNLKINQISVNSARTIREPLEADFIEVWRDLNCVHIKGSKFRQLTYMLSPDHNNLVTLSDRDIQVAETVIQWLGSSVGQGFLESVRAKEDD